MNVFLIDKLFQAYQFVRVLQLALKGDLLPSLNNKYLLMIFEYDLSKKLNLLGFEKCPQIPFWHFTVTIVILLEPKNVKKPVAHHTWFKVLHSKYVVRDRYSFSLKIWICILFTVVEIYFDWFLSDSFLFVIRQFLLNVRYLLACLALKHDLTALFIAILILQGQSRKHDLVPFDLLFLWPWLLSIIIF